MTFGFPAFHTEDYSPDEGRADMRAAVITTIQAISWSIREESPNMIFASSSVSLRSWGEKVTVSFLPDNSISVTSKCSLPTQCFDWGKNKINVQKFLAELRNHL